MIESCRPWRRIFYLVVTLGIGAVGVGLAPNGQASTRRVAKKGIAVAVAAAVPQSGPALTSVIDTVYRADGSAAQGVLVITWPAFVSASGTAVAAGVLDVTLGTNGALDVALAPNAGATPAGSYYTVVYQLGPGEVRSENWVVPTSSPATLAQVRTTPGSGTAAQPVSLQYVNTALAGKANDNAVVHLAGAETVTGAKSFAVPPNVPTPVGTGDVANKSYVDSSIATVGAGNFVPIAGGAMTGPLSLSGNPSAPLQAAPKQYVDTTAAAKANLVTGLVPTNELGSGTATATDCLLGNGTWGACGSSANATEIQSVPVATSAPTNGQVLTYSATSGQYAPSTPSGGVGGVSLTPAASQSIAQPVGTQFSANNLSGIRYVTAGDNWSASPSGSLTAGTPAVVTLTPCPLGVDATGNSMYYVYLSGQGTPEAAMVTGGSCSPAASSGTIAFTPKNAHAVGYVISSATSGIQEAINDACGMPNGSGGNPNARVVLPPTGATANALPVYGTIFAHCSRTLIEGNGTQLACSTRDRCVVLGDLVSSNHYSGVTLRGVNLSSAINADGCQVTSTQRQSNVVTITVAAGCSTIQTGDVVNINFTDNAGYWGSHGPVTVSDTSITYSQTGGNVALASTPGTIAIQNAAIEDNALPGTIEQIQINASAGGKFNQGLVIDNDQAATIRNTDYGGGLLCTANHCGSYVYSAGTSASTPVIWVDKANWSFQCAGNGITDYANNGVKITDSVVQGFGMWGINSQTLLGSFGGTESDNVYMEEGGGPCAHPYEGSYFSAAGFIWFGNVQPLRVEGGEQPGAHIPQFANTGTTQYNYYVVANDTNGSSTAHSFPLVAGFALTNGTGTINGQFPRIPPQTPGDTVTYDILRMQPATGLGSNVPSFPVKGSCTGGSTTACGSVITAQAQCSGLVCTFTDTASANTASYFINNITWLPILPFWPGGIVITGSGGAGSTTPVITTTEPGAVVSVNGDNFPGVLVRGQCGYADNAGTSGGVWKQCFEYGTNSSGFGSVLFNDVGAPPGVKGKFNFQAQTIGGVSAHHLFTLVDSAPTTTLATIGFRPLSNANDTYIGLDASTNLGSAQLAFGAPVSISNYIGNSGDNSSYLERLTASAKTFNVPVSVNGNLTVTGTCTGCGSGAVNSGTSTQLAVYPANGAAVSGDSRFTDSGSTLSYTGSNGISATAGAFSGNVTVNGQLLVAGPWIVSSPIPGTAMAASAAGTSALGISNDGNFYISANSGTPQKVATTGTSSFFSNLFQEDANDLGEFNGLTAQNLHIYSSYTNSSTWQRTSVGFDTADNYAVLRSESSTSGGAPGLGFWINSGLKWVVDATGNLKPWADQSYNIGSFTGTGSGSGLRPGTVYVAGSATSNSGFELGKFANESYEICNDATTGTTLNQLAVLTTGGCAAKPGSALTSGAIGIVIASAGTSGVATLARAGSAFCSFDANPTVIGDYVVPSPTANSGFFPLCRDAGATRPTGTQILGRVLQASAGSSTVQMFLDMPGSNVSSSGAGTGSCTNQAVTAILNGGPTCTTITSAYVDSSIAPAASPALTGTPTAPTATAGDNSTKIATTAYVRSEEYMAWSCAVAGTTATTQYCNWTLPAGITVTGFDLASSTAAAGCSTFPVLQVWDGTASAEVGTYSTTFTSGTNFYTQVAGSTNVASGHQLRFKITTAAGGCTTNAAGIVATITYQMQN